MLLLYMYVMSSVITVMLKSCDFSRPLSVYNLKYFVDSTKWIMNLWRTNMSQNQYCYMKGEGSSRNENVKLFTYHLKDPVVIYVGATWTRYLCVHRTKCHIMGLMHLHMNIVYSELDANVLLFNSFVILCVLNDWLISIPLYNSFHQVDNLTTYPAVYTGNLNHKSASTVNTLQNLSQWMTL
jgi:hypothetical protein